MFKKNFLKLFFVSIFLLWLISGISKADVQSIRMDYCENVGKKTQDDGKLININPWEQKEICLNFSSTQPEEVTVTYWFTESLFNGRWTQICKANMDEENSFSKLWSNDNWNVRSFTIKSGDIKIIKETINVPIGMSWMVYGCFMHKIEAGKSSKMFTVVAVIKRQLNVFIWWAAEIKKWIIISTSKWDIFSTNNKISAKTLDNGKISLGFLIKNNWNVGQNIKIEWNMYNALWFEKTFTTTPVLVGPWIETEINSEALLIPSYKWFFNTEIKLTAEPVFLFNVDGIDPKLQEPIIINETAKIFIFSWIWIIAALVAILVLVLIFRPLFKKHRA